MASTTASVSALIRSVETRDLRGVKREVKNSSTTQAGPVPVDAYHRAAELGHLDICRWFKRHDRLSPVEVVARADRPNALEDARYVALCQSVGYDGSHDIWSSLNPSRRNVLEEQRSEEIQTYLARWQNAGTRCPGLSKPQSCIGGTPLGFAACQGWPHVVATLLTHGAQPDGNFAVGPGKLLSLRGLSVLATFNPFISTPLRCVPGVRIGVRAGFIPVVDAILNQVSFSEDALALLRRDAVKANKQDVVAYLDRYRASSEAPDKTVTAAKLRSKSRFRSYYFAGSTLTSWDRGMQMLGYDTPIFPGYTQSGRPISWGVTTTPDGS